MKTEQIDAPLLKSRKFWSAVSAFVALNSTFLITKDGTLAVIAASGFVTNIAAVWAQNMMNIRKDGGK